MKEKLRHIFSPVLARFESGEPATSYRPSHRKVLLALGVLFSLLCAVSTYLAFSSDQLASLLPAVIFGLVSLVSIVVATLGNDTAVARIWGLK
ncbi:MAG: hypothetical protein CMQ46_04500 [Gammaproteobacteria bacterium]|nr:hypothetical protein [Gammaproteobacteria bacterium]MBJ54508.1 hypothetical protein [Gammaproteobacteria bacterium]HBN15537.1 hypothetical protein [Pseudohongiella sp.]|tara:strand:+ start:116 stop:394 length:279 start_codon:yes stop_codon:yes gene_type:complete